ncbi:aldo/keto reductase [uncultured Chitinophaga sp.]|uniref:aldo/keto reductase n=1 Tax=uncultured Chitinophaga sp. TaxID=339340 RepID=UPI0025CD2565|nr:aldo/keto reductase [uncultured Chitinophaga sp.]
MNYRTFKDVKVAEVGLGTWQLGSADWGVVDEDKALEILKAYTDAGGNFIDTADVYGMGVSERIIGKFLTTVDKEVLVATKLGRRGDQPNGWPQNFGYDVMRKHIEDSLQHLGQSQLFLEQLHCIPTEIMRSGEVFDHLRKFREEGLIRYFGASVETSEEALICLEQEGLASLQIIFNLFRQHVADEVFAKAKEKGVAVIVRVPLASGLLTGKFKEDTVFETKDHRNFNANGEAFNAGETFSGVPFKDGVQFAARIKSLLPDERMAQWAIRWILDHPGVTTVIPGASKLSQVAGNVEAAALPPLPSSTHTALRKLYDEEIYEKIRGHF